MIVEDFSHLAFIGRKCIFEIRSGFIGPDEGGLLRGVDWLNSEEVDMDFVILWKSHSLILQDRFIITSCDVSLIKEAEEKLEEEREEAEAVINHLAVR